MFTEIASVPSVVQLVAVPLLTLTLLRLLTVPSLGFRQFEALLPGSLESKAPLPKWTSKRRMLSLATVAGLRGRRLVTPCDPSACAL